MLVIPCGVNTEVSVFDSNKPEQRAILFLWSRCFEYPRESAAVFGSGSVTGAAGNRERHIVQHRVQNPENVFSSVERRQPVSKELRKTATGPCPRQHA